MSDLVLDASLALRWFLEDEAGRQYSLSILGSLSTNRALVPMLWFYEVGNGLLMAYRRKRITWEQIDGFLTRLKALPIDAAHQVPNDVLELAAIAQNHSLTNYDGRTSVWRCDFVCLWQQPILNCGKRPLERASRWCSDGQNLSMP